MFVVVGKFHWQLEETLDNLSCALTYLTDQKKSGVHHSGTVQHGGHQNIVTRTIHEGDMSNEAKLTTASCSIAWKSVFFIRPS